MDLSIIIVNWNSYEFLDNCIKSIIDYTRGISFEIIVVDNASFDGCSKVVDKYIGVAKLVLSESNIGFARANNLGYRVSGGNTLLFLNPDTIILGESLEKLHKTLLSLENCGCLGCMVLNKDGTIQTSCIQTFPTIINQLLNAEYIRNLFPKARIWGIEPLFESNEIAHEVEAIAGSCLMVRRDVFEKVGLFSEDYFMFAEDIDLCYKMRQFGYRNFYIGKASIVHYGGGSTKLTGKGYFSAVLKCESIKIFMKKFYGNIYSIGFVLTSFIVSIVRVLLLLIVYPLSFINFFDRGNIYHRLNKWKHIFLWSLGMERWVKKYRGIIRTNSI